ncbi:MAG: type II toxin-antitoxin system RelE/ParE family toxin [Endomicrobium sp.]|jgi:proteic killer suppression protein|nr:type II toxin-antitoxin system RelE/ParE family toxin [Endomicrobium sp.]
MLKSFADEEAKWIWSREFSKRIPLQIQRIALRKLIIINVAINLRDLQIPPLNRLEDLQGNRKEKYSIRINNQRRISFVWKDGNAFEVQMELICYRKFCKHYLAASL